MTRSACGVSLTKSLYQPGATARSAPNRYDVNILPAGGLLWTPADDKRFELIFPRPRLAWRVAESDRSSQWVYLAGEFGGNQCAVRRDSGAGER